MKTNRQLFEEFYKEDDLLHARINDPQDDGQGVDEDYKSFYAKTRPYTHHLYDLVKDPGLHYSFHDSRVISQESRISTNKQQFQIISFV